MGFHFRTRNKIHIINLENPPLYKGSHEFLGTLAVGAHSLRRHQTAARTVKEAERCGMPYVNHRWLGGMLTNFPPLKPVSNALKGIGDVRDGLRFRTFQQKRRLAFAEMEKLDRSLGGIKEHGETAGRSYVIDVGHEDIAIAEENWVYR